MHVLNFLVIIYVEISTGRVSNKNTYLHFKKIQKYTKQITKNLLKKSLKKSFKISLKKSLGNHLKFM